MATAPFQLWLDIAPIASAIRVSSTVTVTTSSPHGISTGAYIQMAGAATTAGTSMNGAFEVTVTSGTTFTYTAAGTAGTASVTSACISYDLFNPLINYSGTAKEQALYVDLDSIALSMAGDGGSSSFGFTVNQDDTPADGPWFKLIPDDARVRLVKADTGTSPASDQSDVFFMGIITSIESKLNGAGQGTTSDVTLSDPTAVLERTVLYGGRVSPRSIVKSGGAARSSNVVTVTTEYNHGYQIGQQVVLSGVLGGGGVSFNTVATIAGTPTPTTFTFNQSGSDATSVESITPSAASLKSKSVNKVRLTSTNHGLTNSGPETYVTIAGATASNTTAQDLLNKAFSTNFNKIIVIDANTIELTLATTVSKSTTFTMTGSTLISNPVVAPIQGKRGPTISFEFKSGESESAIISRALEAIHNYKAINPAFQRVFDTSDSSLVAGSTTAKTDTTLKIDPTTFRSFLDTVVETFTGIDGKPRRYFINTSGKLVYGLVDQASAPVYATAPYAVITSGAGDYNAVNAKSTIAVSNLEVTWNHETTKQVVFSAPQAFAEVILTVKDYTQVGYTPRANSITLDGQLDYPTAVKNAPSQIAIAASAFMAERHKPLMSGRFILRGAGTQSFNQYGFNAGYAQTGASTFALVSRWLPNQWVEVTSTELGLSGLYRVEEVEWSLEPGAFLQVITITFNRRLPDTLTQIISRWNA